MTFDLQNQTASYLTSQASKSISDNLDGSSGAHALHPPFLILNQMTSSVCIRPRSQVCNGKIAWSQTKIISYMSTSVTCSICDTLVTKIWSTDAELQLRMLTKGGGVFCEILKTDPIQ